jgi:hypothetical protein
MIRSEHMKSCLTAQIRFMLFKGPGFFKINFKIGGNVEKLKAYRLIPFTHPLLFHFTLPLRQVFEKHLPAFNNVHMKPDTIFVLLKREIRTKYFKN